MSTNYSTTNQSYKHLSEAERGEIEAYLSVGLKPAEIARRLGRNRSTITREINRGSITQVKKVNGQKVYYQHYYADAAHNRYRHAREASYYLKLDCVEERPEEINNRSRFGDWEIDSVLGGKTIGEPSILTLVERQTRYAVTKKLVEKKAEYVNQAVLECMKLYPIKSITADNGNEFSSLSKTEGLDVYFAHAYSSYERGTNENFNGLLREFIPKGCSLKELNQNLLEDYTKAINERPRRIHGYQSAKKLFELTQTA